MNLPSPSVAPARRQILSGFTLPEMMIAVTVYTVVMLGVLIGLQVFAMRMYTLAACKTTSTTSARQALNAIRDQIRGGMNVMVGNYVLPSSGIANGSNGFTQPPTGTAQQGNALAVLFENRLSTNYNIFYLDSTTPTNMMCWVSNSAPVILAKWITNTTCFYLEDFQGNVQSNTAYAHNPVVRVTMFFSQWEYPIAIVGSNEFNAFDFYRLQTRVSNRAK